MKSNTTFYKLILLLQSAILVSVFAQQPPRTLSTVDAELSKICGKASSPYAERVRLIHSLPSNLAPEQRERCRAFLEWTRQIHAQENIAAKLGKKYTIYTGEKTYVPASFSNIDVQKRSFLGPQ